MSAGGAPEAVFKHGDTREVVADGELDRPECAEHEPLFGQAEPVPLDVCMRCGLILSSYVHAETPGPG
jgi:hypothetical protein